MTAVFERLFFPVHPPQDIQALPGTSVEGVSLGGSGYQQTVQLIENIAAQKEALPVVLTFEGRRGFSTVRDLGLYVDREAILAKIISAGQKGGLASRLKERWQAYRFGMPVQVSYKEDREVTRQRLAAVVGSTSRSPRNAKLIVNPDDSVSILPSEPGWELEVASLLAELRNRLESGQHLEVDVGMLRIQPDIPTAQVQAWRISGLLASFNTRFNQANANRSSNIQVAAAKLQDLMVAPGEVFSFNKIIGPCSAKAGYKEAPVIRGKEYILGLGGGICQVSSTLYNAVLRANLPVVERHRHSLAVDYVQLGLDATVAEGLLDLRFKNDTGGFLLLRTGVAEGQLNVKIYGKADRRVQIDILSEVEKVADPPVTEKTDLRLLAGQVLIGREGTPGYKARVIREVSMDGKVIKRELISEDSYPPLSKVIYLGPVWEMPAE